MKNVFRYATAALFGLTGVVALVSAAVVMAQPDAAQAPAFSIDEAMVICRSGMFEDGARAVAAIKALPQEQQAPVAILCIGYEAGFADARFGGGVVS